MFRLTISAKTQWQLSPSGSSPRPSLSRNTATFGIYSARDITPSPSRFRDSRSVRNEWICYSCCQFEALQLFFSSTSQSMTKVVSVVPAVFTDVVFVLPYSGPRLPRFVVLTFTGTLVSLLLIAWLYCRCRKQQRSSRKQSYNGFQVKARLISMQAGRHPSILNSGFASRFFESGVICSFFKFIYFIYLFVYIFINLFFNFLIYFLIHLFIF